MFRSLKDAVDTIGNELKRETEHIAATYGEGYVSFSGWLDDDTAKMEDVDGNGYYWEITEQKVR